MKYYERMIRQAEEKGKRCFERQFQDALQSLEGVHTAVADLQQKNVVVDYDDTVVSVSNLKDAVGASGKYELVG